MKISSVDQIWQPLPVCGNARLRRWLIDRGSLTRRIQQRCERFQLRVLAQGLAHANRDEGTLFAAGNGHHIVREVTLNCDGKAVVFAHSVIERSAVHGAWHMLTTLGARPLGAALFADPRIERYPLRFRQLNRTHELYRRAKQFKLEGLPVSLWARRSLFVLRGSRLLVTEVFLPPLLTLAL